MEKLIIFLKIIAWAIAIISTIFTFLTIWGTLTYPGSADEWNDKLRGIRREYPVARWLIAAIISWAFIIAF
jgi:hypothetical protein